MLVARPGVNGGDLSERLEQFMAALHRFGKVNRDGYEDASIWRVSDPISSCQALQRSIENVTSPTADDTMQVRKLTLEAISRIDLDWIATIPQRLKDPL